MILIPLLHVIYTAVALASAKPEGEALSSFFVISNFEGLDMMWLCRNYAWFREKLNLTTDTLLLAVPHEWRK